MLDIAGIETTGKAEEVTVVVIGGMRVSSILLNVVSNVCVVMLVVLLLVLFSLTTFIL